MFKVNRLGAFSAATFCMLWVSGCSDSSPDPDPAPVPESQLVVDLFDNAVEDPVGGSLPLDRQAIAPLMFAIQSNGFETEYDSIDQSSPHQLAWDRLNVWSFADGENYQSTLSCHEVAISRGGVGKGTVTITSEMRGDSVGYVEHSYDDCVVQNDVYSGTRRLTVFEGPGEFSAAGVNFQWEYENYYWGEGGVQYSLDGVVVYEEQEYGTESIYRYQSTSNYTLAVHDGYRYKLENLVSICRDNSREALFGEGGWECSVESGDIVLDSVGRYSVESLSPTMQSIWTSDGKLQFSDDSAGHVVFWGDSEGKKSTFVDAGNREKTFIVEYESSSSEELVGSLASEPDSAVTIAEAKYKLWDSENYSSLTDEYILFDLDRPSVVDVFHRGIDGTSSDRQIDLVEPAFSVNVIFEGDTLISGHDGSTRTIHLQDPALESNERIIGLGKVVALHDEHVLAYQVPGNDDQLLVSYRWDVESQTVSETNIFGYVNDYGFDYKNGIVAEGAYSEAFFYTDSITEHNYSSVDVGENQGYLKFLDNELVVTGSGALVKCTSNCVSRSVYWRSLNEAILAKYPAETRQFVVAAATDTEGLYTTPNYLVFATVSQADWASRYHIPESGNALWVVDLNDMSRIKKVSVVDELSSPTVGLNVRQLFNRKGDNSIVGVGSWDLMSGRESTVLFEIDLDEIEFD